LLFIFRSAGLCGASVVGRFGLYVCFMAFSLSFLFAKIVYRVSLAAGLGVGV